MKGHRDRVRGVIAENGLSSLPDYQILEYLLFHGIPRKDTKIIAYRLLKKFGSLSGVLEAPIKELSEVPDMTYNAALFLHSLPEVCSAYQVRRLEGRKIISPKQVVPYVRTLAALDRESLFVICMDEKNNFICGDDLIGGKVDRVQAEASEILSYAVDHKAKKLILVHNHPSGDYTPSHEDIMSTLGIKKILASINVEMLDHIVIAGQKAYSIFLNKEITP